MRLRLVEVCSRAYRLLRDGAICANVGGQALVGEEPSRAYARRLDTTRTTNPSARSTSAPAAFTGSPTAAPIERFRLVHSTVAHSVPLLSRRFGFPLAVDVDRVDSRGHGGLGAPVHADGFCRLVEGPAAGSRGVSDRREPEPWARPAAASTTTAGRAAQLLRARSVIRRLGRALGQYGRRQLAVETNKWKTLVRAIARVLRPA
jgi:hypothetical protein